MVQQKQPIQVDPRVMYRGVGANMVNMGSCTMIQFAIGGKLKQMVAGEADRKLTLAQEMGCGIVAGSVSALVGSPLELIMIQQQRKGGSTAATFRSIANPTNFYRGLIGAAVREALWTCGYLSIPPVVRSYLMENHPEQFPDNNRARIPAALLGGLFACYLTQPADTIKTCLQLSIFCLLNMPCLLVFCEFVFLNLFVSLFFFSLAEVTLNAPSTVTFVKPRPRFTRKVAFPDFIVELPFVMVEWYVPCLSWITPKSILAS